MFEYEEIQLIEYVSSGRTADIGYRHNQCWGFNLYPSISPSELSALMRPSLTDHLKDQLSILLEEEDQIDWDSFEVEIGGMGYDPEDGLMYILFAWSARLTKGDRNEEV